MTTGCGIFICRARHRRYQSRRLHAALPHLDSLLDSIETFVETVDMELLLLVLGTVNVDVCSGFGIVYSSRE